jgi:hypothetical protein
MKAHGGNSTTLIKMKQNIGLLGASIAMPDVHLLNSDKPWILLLEKVRTCDHRSQVVNSGLEHLSTSN